MKTYSYSNHIFPNDSKTDRPTASSYHCLVLPTWWSFQDENDSSFKMSYSKLNKEMKKTSEYFSEMSWGKMDLTYEVRLKLKEPTEHLHLTLFHYFHSKNVNLFISDIASDNDTYYNKYMGSKE